MRILVLGAGAVGGYFGARLAEGGHEVTLVDRGAHLEALRRNGLVLELPDETRRLASIAAVGDPSDAPPCELVLVCVKSYDTAAAAAALGRAVQPDTVILSLQNGIENESVLAEALGLPPLLVGLAIVGAEVVAPGTIRYSGHGEILFGEADGRESPRARRVADAFTAAAVPHQLRRDVLVAAWEKLSWNSAFNAVTTLTRTTVAGVLALPRSRALIEATMIETDAVATAAGVPVHRDRLAAVLAECEGMSEGATSMADDLRHGRPLEHEALNGAVVRVAAHTGVPAPLNTTLRALLARLDPGTR